MTRAVIHIAPLERVASLSRRLPPPVHVIGLLGPGMEHPVLPVPEERRLRLSFHDVAEERPGFLPPDAEHVRTLVDFARRWRQRSEGALLLHCWMGVSRSPAAAFIVQCAFHPGADEFALARELRSIAPFATPNRRLVALADALLEREGRMTAAIAEIGRGEEACIGRPVAWPLPDVEDAA